MDEKKERMFEEKGRDASAPVLPIHNPLSEKSESQKPGIPAAVYIAVWIALSSSVILFNKWVLDKKQFTAFLTTWHLLFATIMTQLLARFTRVLDSRKNVPMTGRVYIRAIVPIGMFFSLSLICSNISYIYLSVSFIQMLKATTPVAVLITTWFLGLAPPSMKTLGNVSIIVFGVIVASVGEIKFVLFGVLIQIAGILFEAIRLAMVQGLLSGSEFKMDPLVSLYYFAPACATMNFMVFLVMELPTITMEDITRVGYSTLFANASVAFALNVAVVLLIGKTSSLVLTLSGVLKDILLVMASMLLFHDPVTPLQAIGYSIALGGLMYYKLGGDKMKEYIHQGSNVWADYGNRHPIMRKLIVFGSVILGMFVLISGIAPRYGTEWQTWTPSSH
ncbi:TPT-domain-containing protein [Rhizodiscina lignyota]|uniref:TPT-domain-containing protein n=1 Tax=Rhizodiscina lignyota TaxID=1504668 RepID=A0A9P4M8V6_9PEZI|nr:TPT-domain-containing protein [Rhizodiscina lignyota]